MNKIIVLDTETNKEFEVIRYEKDSEEVVIHNDEYGFCQQPKGNLNFVRAEK